MDNSRNWSLGGSGNKKHRIPKRPVSPTLEQLQQVIEQLSANLAALRKQDALSPKEALTACVSTEANLAASPTVPRIVEELLEAKASDGLSNRYIETIRSHLHRFGQSFNGPIGAITTSQIDRWLRNQNVGPRARNNLRGSIVTLFHFAQKQGYLTKGQPTEADDVAKAKDFGGKIGILTAQQLAPVLNHAPEKSCLFLALGAFTGMRSSEILRLDWADINLERKFIIVAAHKAKTATRRLVPILANLMAWLTRYSERTGPLFKARRDADRAILFAKGCGLEWPSNALRHSYATYRLAETANAAQVALELGNSPQKLMTNYRELADEIEAKAWFGIFPPSAGT